jgi:hypothetical protein
MGFISTEKSNTPLLSAATTTSKASISFRVTFSEVISIQNAENNKTFDGETFGALPFYYPHNGLIGK